MTGLTAAIDGAGSELASWSALGTLLALFGIIVTALVVFGRSGGNVESRIAAFLLRTPNALERLTTVPGWAAATVGLSLYGLLVAGEGFYSDGRPPSGSACTGCSSPARASTATSPGTSRWAATTRCSPRPTRRS